MAYQNKLDPTGQCSRDGESAELAFKKILQKRKESFRDATLKEQFAHSDLTVSKDGKEIKYDIKARKKSSRSDSDFNDEQIWVELLNVNGNAGWLYGKNDKLAFEQVDSFIIVDRVKLIDLIERKCNIFEIVKYSGDALYKGYRRYGRKDHLTIILTSDIIEIADEVVKKV